MAIEIGLFSRRAYNVEGILCLPACLPVVGDGRCRRAWLPVEKDRRPAQMMKSVEKLEDVSAIRRHFARRQVFLQKTGSDSRNQSGKRTVNSNSTCSSGAARAATPTPVMQGLAPSNNASNGGNI